MALSNLSLLESLFTSSSSTRWDSVSNPEGGASVSFNQPLVYQSINSHTTGRKSHRTYSTNWRSKRVFSFGSNDTILQNDVYSGDLPDLTMLLQTKQVLQTEDVPMQEVVEPDTDTSHEAPEPESQAGSVKSKQRAQKTYNLVFVSAEVAPYSKVGGLSDVCGSLPVVLASRGHRVMVISPRYINGVTDHRYAGAYDAQCRVRIGCFSGQHEVAFFHEYKDGVDWVFVDHCCYHRPGNPYGDSRGAFGDNQFFFCSFDILYFATLHAKRLWF